MLMGNNTLSGTLPREWRALTQLQMFSLHNNKLFGPIPSTWNMPGLSVVQLDNNNFTGDIPTTWLAKSKALSWFSASNNNFTGSLAPLRLTGKPKLTVLDLHQNAFSGQISSALAPNLQVMRVGQNSFTSTLPTLPAKLLLLDASNNSLTGGVPSLPQSLVYLKLDNNMLTAMAPLNVPNLTIASLANNRLSRQLPANWSHALQLLNISNNQLTNTLPQSWANHTWVLLDISGNAFSGPLPDVLPARVLVAGRNKLSGTLPEHWPEKNSMASIVDLKANHLHGSLPTSWFDAPKVTSKPGNFQFLDISNNSFVGGVPFEWIRLNGTRLVLGKEMWIQRRTLAKLLLGKERKWSKAVCTNPNLYHSMLDVTRVREVDTQVASLVIDVQERLLEAARAVAAGSSLVRDEFWSIDQVMSIMYMPWSDLRDPSPYLKRLQAVKIQPDIKPSDLCSNPAALSIVLVLWIVLLDCLLVCWGVYLWLRPIAMHRSDTSHKKGVAHWLLAHRDQAGGAFSRLVGIVMKLVNVGSYWADIVTDLLVIINVSGNNWPFYALAAIFLCNYVYSASVLTWQMLHIKGTTVLQWICLFPAILVSLPVLDTLAFMHSAGVPVQHVARAIMRGVDVDMDKYHEGRSLMETFLESVPSSIVQSIIFFMGNSPDRPMYVDLWLFMCSIIFSGARIVMTFVSIMWEGLFHPDGIQRRTQEVLLGIGVFGTSSAPLLPRTQ